MSDALFYMLMGAAAGFLIMGGTGFVIEWIRLRRIRQRNIEWFAKNIPESSEKGGS